MEEYQIYTDGSCCSKGENKGLGGYGVYSPNFEGVEITDRCGYRETTISRMEMKAFLHALRMVDKTRILRIRIVTDSTYVYESLIEGRVTRWEIEGWCCANADVWKEIIRELRMRGKMILKLNWVRGHQKDIEHPDVFGNAMADVLANYKTQKEYIVDTR